MARASHVDGDLLGTFRLAFGLINAVGALKFLLHPPINFGYHFSYQGCEVPMLGPTGYSVLVGVSLIAALGIACGRGLRGWAWLYFFSFGYWFLLEKSNYNNHYYLILLLTLFWALLGDGGFLAWGRGPGREIPRWHLQLFQGQLILVYFYGGLAKLHRDWFLGHPMDQWLGGHPWWGLMLSWAGLFFDLLIGPALLYRPTRPLAMLLAFGFHLSNSQLFRIGVFPYLMMASLVLFLDPGWLRSRAPKAWRKPPAPGQGRVRPHPGWYLFAAWQVLMPLRHHLYPGNVDWNAEGAQFAWRMKLVDHGGKIDFIVEQADGTRRLIDPREELIERQINAMQAHPEMIVDYARSLKERHQLPGKPPPRVRALAWIRLNHRQPQYVFDPELDVAGLPLRLWGHNPHIQPLRARITENPRLAAWLQVFMLPYLALAWWPPGRGQRPLRWQACQLAVVLCLASSSLTSSLLPTQLALISAGLAGLAWLPSRSPALGLYTVYQLLWIWALWLARTGEAG